MWSIYSIDILFKSILVFSDELIHAFADVRRSFDRSSRRVY